MDQRKLVLQSLCLVLSCLLNDTLGADTLRSRSLALPEAAPTMDLYFDYELLDRPKEDFAKWETHDKEILYQINEFEKALKGKLAANDRFDLQVKLYEHLLEHEVFLRHSIQRQYFKNWDAFSRGELDTQPELDFSEAQRVVFKAISHMRELVAAYKTHPRLDQVTFQLAQNLCRIRNDNHKFYFGQFDRQFPKSGFSQKVALAKADCFLEANDHQNALASYRTILADNSIIPAIKSYSAYRLGWLYLADVANPQAQNQQSQLLLAERAFKAAVQYAGTDDDAEERHFNVKDEALLDLAWIFALGHQEGSAKSYFTTQKQEALMGYYYYRHGLAHISNENYAGAVSDFAQIKKSYPEFPEAPFTFRAMSLAYEKLSYNRGVVESMQSLAALVSEDSDWFEAFEDDVDRIESTRKLVEFALKDASIRYRSIGFEQNNNEAKNTAIQILITYLKAFPEISTHRDLRFQLASLLFEVQNFKAAADQFALVLEDIPEEHELRRDSAYNLVLSLSNFDKLQSYPKIPAGRIKKPIDIPELKTEVIKSMEFFVDAFAHDEAAMPMRFAINEIYMEYGHYEEALAQLESIALENPDTDAGLNALQTILTHYSGNGKWLDLRETTLKYLENPKFLLPKHQKLLSESLTEAEANIKTKKAQK